MYKILICNNSNPRATHILAYLCPDFSNQRVGRTAILTSIILPQGILPRPLMLNLDWDCFRFHDPA